MTSLRPLCLAALLLGLTAAAQAGSVLVPTQEIAKASKALAKAKSLVERMKVAKPGAVLAVPEPRQDAEGKYVCPYLADGSLAPWASKGIGAAAGVAGVVGGDMLADQAGDLAGKALADKVPGAGALGSLFGRKASKKVSDTATVKALGGWDYIRETSDLSFDSVMDLAVYLHTNHAAVDEEYALAVAATMGIHPRLVGAYEPALKRAYSRAEIRAVPDPVVTENTAVAGNAGAESSGLHSRALSDSLTADMDPDEAAVAAGLLATVVDANTTRSSGGAGGSGFGRIASGARLGATGAQCVQGFQCEGQVSQSQQSCGGGGIPGGIRGAGQCHGECRGGLSVRGHPHLRCE